MKPTWSREQETLFERHRANPLLTAEDWPYAVNTIFNAGATLLSDWTTLLLCRVEDRRGVSHLCAARSSNGVDGWTIDPVPTLLPNPDEYPEEKWGIEDSRLTWLAEWNATPWSIRTTRRRDRACRWCSPGTSTASSVTARFFRRKTKTPRCCRGGSARVGR